MSKYFRTHAFKINGDQGTEIAILVNPDPSKDNQYEFNKFIADYERPNIIIADITSEDIGVFHWVPTVTKTNGDWRGMQQEDYPDWLHAWILINK